MLRHVGIRQNWWSRGLWNSGRFVFDLLIYFAFWELDFLFASRRLFIILHPQTETLKNMCYQMMSGIVLKKYTSYCRYVVSINSYLIQLLTMLFFIVQHFKKGSNFITGQLYPTLSYSVPVYNYLLDKIEDEIAKRTTRPYIKAAAKAAEAKIKDYYPSTDGRVFTIATGKSNWFLVLFYSRSYL